MRLRTKFVLVLLGLTLVLGGLVYGGLEAYKATIVSQERAEVNETAARAADGIGATIRVRRDFVGYMASRPVATEYENSDRFLRELVSNSRFFAAQLIARNGTLIDFRGDVTQDARRESIGANLSGRRYFEVAATGEAYVGDPEPVNATGGHLVVISAPVFEDRKVAAVLAAAMYVEDSRFLSAVRPLETTDRSVTVTAGGEVVHAPHRRFEQAITASADDGAFGWTVTVSRDRTPLTERLRLLALAQGAGLLLVLGVVTGLGVWEYRTTLDQTDRLLRGFEAIQRGEFDRRLSLAAADEWERIAEGFNELAGQLADREAALRRREQHLQVLNRVLRHNLRNSMAVVSGYAERLSEHEDEAVAEHAGIIADTAEELSELSRKAGWIEDVLGGDTPERADLDLVEAVESALGTVRSEYPEAVVSADLPEAASVRVHPAIWRAVEAICENACEHNPSPAPELDVDVTVDGDRVRLAIADDGPGIPSAEVEAITEGRETQLEHASGLGLWLAYWTVERSGGTLSFEAVEPTGTEVVIDLERAT